MMWILSKEEVEEENRKIEEWWSKLDWNTKQNIRSLIQPFIDKYELEHYCINKNEHQLYAVRYLHKFDNNEEIPVICCKRSGCHFRIENDRELLLKLIEIEKEREKIK